MSKTLQTLFWFLKRPSLYPHLVHLVSKKLGLAANSAREDTQQEALQWCAKRSIDTNTALEQLTGRPLTKSVHCLFSQFFQTAEDIVKECPVKMGGPGDLDLLYWSAEYLEATKIVETGVAYGWSSLAILLSLGNREDSKLISTDMPYPRLNNDAYVGCVVPQQLRSNWCILRYADRQALPKALKTLNTIDMCHYDSGKSYADRMWAYPILWQALRPGGFFISDDIGDNIAFKDFSQRIACDPIIVKNNNKYIGIMVKPSNVRKGICKKERMAKSPSES